DYCTTMTTTYLAKPQSHPHCQNHAKEHCSEPPENTQKAKKNTHHQKRRSPSKVMTNLHHQKSRTRQKMNGRDSGYPQRRHGPRALAEESDTRKEKGKPGNRPHQSRRNPSHHPPPMVREQCSNTPSHQKRRRLGRSKDDERCKPSFATPGQLIPNLAKV
ncbi:hypothetical protein FRC01_014646, partial [Tulasnella sp. 417]